MSINWWNSGQHYKSFKIVIYGRKLRFSLERKLQLYFVILAKAS